MKPDNYPVEPAHLWEHFYQITQIPRPSKEEAAVRQYVIDQAEAGGHEWRLDEEGNLVVYVAGSGTLQGADPVIIQNHLDMVTVKTADRVHNFSTDPLRLVIEDGWLGADRTTLGADNGVGCAAAIALMTDPAIQHPPLELLFTVDEETGLNGALNLDASLLSGSVMLNLDTEEWNELYIGCTGGGGWEFSRQFSEQAFASGTQVWEIAIAGLSGGHSGIQIHQQLGNAVKILGQALTAIDAVQLVSLDVGLAHNVIPREGVAVFGCLAGGEQQLQELIEQLREDVLSYLPAADAQLTLTLARASATQGLSIVDTRALLDLIAVFPHGAQSYSLEQPADLVDTSTNLAVTRLQNGTFFLEGSLRFFNERESVPIQRNIEAIARAYALTLKPVAGYPGWQPDFSSPLLARGIALHTRLYGHAPAVKAIHAGLECGILKSKKPDTDILSFGPTIRGAHSPTERLEIATVGPFWHLLTELLVDLSSSH